MCTGQQYCVVKIAVADEIIGEILIKYLSEVEVGIWGGKLYYALRQRMCVCVCVCVCVSVCWPQDIPAQL